jgi:cytochrome d ubiquinol oxidase subunit I
MDVLLLSRLQFALTIMFHYLFPPLTIGLSLVIVYLLAMHLRTRDAIYETAARFWVRIFGLNFALGVATGIVMEFEFGTNWAVYSRYVGDVFGSALAAEGIFAFFLESGFLAVLLFGWDRVSPRFHFVSALMVCLGSIFSSIWITVANSWQQTPAGFVLREHTVGGRVFERAEITDFWAMVFNPSSVHRLVHVWFGAFILGAFFVLSVSAWYLLRGKHTEFARRSFSGALVMAAVFSAAQAVSGDLQAKNVAAHQPAKLAAYEGLYETTERAPLWLWGWPDDEAGRVRAGVAVPGLLSWLVHGDADAPVAGLDRLEPAWGRPPVWLSFQSYHLMIACGVLFIVLSLYGLLRLRRGRLWTDRRLLWCFVFAVVPAFAANQLGWVAAEVGRQPWIVYPSAGAGGLPEGGLRTSEALSEAVTAGQVTGSIVMFGLIYLLLGAVWIRLLHGKIQHGPDPVPRPAAGTSLEDYLRTASRLARRRGSMTGPPAPAAGPAPAEEVE